MKKTLLTLTLVLAGCLADPTEAETCKPTLTTHAGAVSCSQEETLPPAPDCCELAATDLQAFRDQCGLPGKCREFACSYGTTGVCLPLNPPTYRETVEPKL